jgi:hypothetical protein
MLLLALALAGCVSSKGKQDTFETFRLRVVRQISDRAECSPIERLDVKSPRFFRVTPADSAAHVLIREMELVSEAEWSRRFREGAKTQRRLKDAIQRKETGQTELTPELQKQAAALDDYWSLPDGVFGDISVDVSVVVPEVVYDGLKGDEQAARALFDQVVRLLKPYKP